MEKDLELIRKALEKANQRGVFTLEESAVIFNATQVLNRELTKLKIQVDQFEKQNSLQKEDPRKEKEYKVRQNEKKS